MKKLIPTILSGLLLSITLTACGDPQSQKVSELTGAQKNALAQQLHDEDLKIFLSYMKRQTTVNASSQDSRDSVTIKQAIAEERDWIANEQQRKVLEEQKEIEKRKAADQAKLKENYQGKETTDLINNALNYKLVDKANVEGKYSQPHVSFDIFLENKTEKDIIYISGVLTVKDDLERKIKDFAFVYEDENTPFEAKKSINYKARLKLNMREPSDIDLSTITFEKIQSSIAINEIIFKDKSKLKMPNQQ